MVSVIKFKILVLVTPPGFPYAVPVNHKYQKRDP